MTFHFLVRFEPLPGKADEFRDLLEQIIPLTRGETGCLALHAFESVREPRLFAIHSEWTDEAAFNLHAEMPHTVRFVQAAEKLLSHHIEGLRLNEIA